MNDKQLRALGFEEYDPADYLTSAEDVAEYLQATFDEAEGDASAIARALGNVARAQGAMTDIAMKTGLSRESLYKALSGQRNPELGTFLKVVIALGLRLTLEPKAKPAPSPVLVASTPTPDPGVFMFVVDVHRDHVVDLAPTVDWALAPTTVDLAGRGLFGHDYGVTATQAVVERFTRFSQQAALTLAGANTSHSPAEDVHIIALHHEHRSTVKTRGDVSQSHVNFDPVSLRH